MLRKERKGGREGRRGTLVITNSSLFGGSSWGTERLTGMPKGTQQVKESQDLTHVCLTLQPPPFDHSLPCWLSCLHGWRFPEIIFLLSALKVSQPFLWLLPSARYFLCYINLSFVALGFFYKSLKLIQERCLSFQSILYPTPKAIFERKDGYLRFSLCTRTLLPLFVYQQHVHIFRMNT